MHSKLSNNDTLMTPPSKGLLYYTAHSNLCPTRLSDINLKSATDRVDCRRVYDTEGFISAVTIHPHPQYFPVECDIGAPSTTGEVCTVTHGDIMALNILCECQGHCIEKEYHLVTMSNVLARTTSHIGRYIVMTKENIVMTKVNIIITSSWLF